MKCDDYFALVTVKVVLFVNYVVKTQGCQIQLTLKACDFFAKMTVHAVSTLHNAYFANCI